MIETTILLAPHDESVTPGRMPQSPDTSSNHEGFQVLVLTRYLTHRNPSAIPHLCRTHAEAFGRRRIHFITTIQASDHPAAPAYLSAIESAECRPFVTNVGALTRAQVWESLCRCDVLWMPTLLETFCLPFVEAMYAGVPILAPDLDFARFVCDEAAVYYDPWRIDSIAEGLIRLADDSLLRNRLTEAGQRVIRNSTRFAGSWDEAAENLLDALDSIR